MPKTNTTPAQQYFFMTAVKQRSLTGGPALSRAIDTSDATKPIYRTHELFPDLGGKSMMGVGWRLGIAEGIGVSYHNSAIQVLPKLAGATPKNGKVTKQGVKVGTKLAVGSKVNLTLKPIKPIVKKHPKKHRHGKK